MLLDGNVSGNLEVTAGRNIDNTLPTSIQRFLNDDVHSGASSGSANLPALNLSASALDLNAVGDVNLSGGNISVGAGVSSVTGDHALTNALGLGSLDPSLFISAGGTLSLPTVNFTGNYALIEANSITQFASVTAQPGSLVQLTPLDNTRTVGINAIGGGGQQTEFTGADLSLFNVGTLAIGSSTLTGTMTVGANGAVNLGSTNLVLADQTAIQGSGALSAAALTLLEGATTDVNLITNTGVISVGTGHDISIDNSAYTTGITTFTLATTPYNSVSLLAGGGMSITGLLTAASITASGGAGAVNLLTDTAALNIASGTDVVLDNSAETAATVLTFGAGTLGNVSAIFGGTATLGSGLNATSLILSAPGALDLGTGNLVLSGAATLIGAGITGTGLLTAGSITAGGGIGAVNLKTETTALIVASGTDITLDNSAETGAAFVGFASGSYGNVALNFSGDGVLGTNLNAGEFAMVSNNGSLDLSGQALALTTSLQLIAKQDIILTGVGIVVPIMTAVAGGDIHDGGTTGSISVDGLTMTATGNILMPLTQFNLGGGVVPGVNGDAGLLAVLSPLGLAPTSSNPNALLVAGGQLQLGGINFTGSYLYMQAAGVNVLGPVTTAPGALIQFAPPAVGDAVGIENLPATTADINLSNQQFLGQFPAVTLAIGNSDQSGNVDIGANGTIVLPDGTNFLVLTTGTVTGLENISSTGLVKNLLGTLTYTPTTGDIDPSASSTSSNTTSSDDDKKKKESDTEDTGTQQSSDTTAVTHDDSPASVCHG
ncbi:MAG TPA: hypothetical protein VFX47_00425 [Gammaproteobacteria bacterium]|nr:hypothetical protein [Gammaproteobacteria bacterium]